MLKAILELPNYSICLKICALVVLVCPGLLPYACHNVCPKPHSIVLRWGSQKKHTLLPLHNEGNIPMQRRGGGKNQHPPTTQVLVSFDPRGSIIRTGPLLYSFQAFQYTQNNHWSKFFRNFRSCLMKFSILFSKDKPMIFY